MQQYCSAYEHVYKHSRCWYTRNGTTCRNTSEGHSRGHQDWDGDFFGSGDYETPYSDKSRVNFGKRIVELSNRTLSKLPASNSAIRAFAQAHLGVLQSERPLWQTLSSHRICFGCLLEGPDFGLTCGHAICSYCVELFGEQVKQESIYRLKFCPLCRQGSQNEDYWAEIRLKPAQAGVRVLAIDGGGVRGTVSVRILQALEKELGLGLPLSHFFDVIVGTSSGKPFLNNSLVQEDLF